MSHKMHKDIESTISNEQAKKNRLCLMESLSTSLKFTSQNFDCAFL